MQTGTASCVAQGKRLKRAGLVVGVALIGTPVVVAFRSLWHEVRYADVVAALHDMPWSRMPLALGAAARSDAALIGYDATSLTARVMTSGALLPGVSALHSATWRPPVPAQSTGRARF